MQENITGPEFRPDMIPLSNISTMQELDEILAGLEMFSSLDRHFALFIGRLAKNYSPAAFLAAVLVSSRTGAGNICLELAEYAGKPLSSAIQQPGMPALICPPLPEWTDQLMQSGIASHGKNNTPLVLDGAGRLYLRRYWEYENIVVSFIQNRAVPIQGDISYTRLGRDLQKLFGPLPAGEIDWQQVAAFAAAVRSFCVISGGPGTGKTFTVAKILKLLSSQHRNANKLRVLLAAPTGKAASLLEQAITDSGLLPADDIIMRAATLHRMLGYIPHSPYFRHNAENPLAADIIVVDEASMVDLPLMAKLMLAVPPAARLILLGDRHQLASVQPGSVLGDICRTGIMASFSDEFCSMLAEVTGCSLSPQAGCKKEKSPSMLPDSFIELSKSYRFAPESSIAKLGKTVREGDTEGALALLQETEDNSVTWSEIPAPAELGQKLQGSHGVALLSQMQQEHAPDSCFSYLDNFRILCALRSGPFGMERINSILEKQFASPGPGRLTDAAGFLPESRQSSIRVLPLMVTQNDYNLRLFNGEVGIIMPAPDNQGPKRVFFKGEYGKLRDIAPSLLPDHEGVFALTVHKSQGSEFDSVLLILPDQHSPLLSRELLYTAITRARKKIEIWGAKEIFAAAVKQPIKRTSGLGEALWGADRSNLPGSPQ